MKKTSKALWQDYRFLTKEMKKFLIKPDMDLFYELMEQRGRLQTIIDKTADDGFKVLPEGQNLLTEIQQDNQFIIEHMQFQLNRMKRHHQVSEAYASTNDVPVSRMSWKR